MPETPLQNLLALAAELHLDPIDLDAALHLFSGELAIRA
ncbi:hypothetical protein SAMN05421854_110255 [Amycolatopsis rubida]|uniref:Uncharacterized protein n=1 Tax=Amycolatopsis rubida TaxID=112413 RepID=A0A1I5XI91_9PSEU|nr:hypothetical protein SAMN05421854_110255 [Amycolatopsis rubida]